MATKKVYDLVGSMGTYQGSDGQTRYRNVNLGGLFKTDDGKVFCLMHAHVNLAAFPRKEGSEDVMVSVFPAQTAEERAARTAGNAPAQQRAPARPAAPAVEDDDIPF